jgi:hypothetical protein
MSVVAKYIEDAKWSKIIHYVCVELQTRLQEVCLEYRETETMVSFSCIYIVLTLILREVSINLTDFPLMN